MTVNTWSASKIIFESTKSIIRSALVKIFFPFSFPPHNRVDQYFDNRNSGFWKVGFPRNGINHHFQGFSPRVLYFRKIDDASPPSSNRHLSSPLFRLYEATTLPLPLRSILIVRDSSRENTRLGSFHRASLLRILLVFQRATNTIVAPTRAAILTFK